MSILAIVEQREGEFRKVTYEVLTLGKKLANDFKCNVIAVAIGSGITAEKVKSFGDYGVSEVLSIDQAPLASYDGRVYAGVIQKVIAQKSPKVVVFSHSSQGKDLAPRVSALTGMAYLPDVIEVQSEGGSIRAKRPIFAGKLNAVVQPKAGLGCVLSLRPNVFTASKSSTVNVNLQKLDLALDAAQAPVKEIIKGAEKKIDLTEAEIIVSGGRGMKEPANFETILYPLAAQLGAAIGASRAVVDAGWRSHGDQVGQTGKTVTPNLYFAIGISGAIQHLAGMGSSKCIVAINKDKDAPIFQVADYGIVGDLFEVVPALTAEIKKMKES